MRLHGAEIQTSAVNLVIFTPTVELAMMIKRIHGAQIEDGLRRQAAVAIVGPLVVKFSQRFSGIALILPHPKAQRV